jgi:hypothetical protein
MDCFINCSGANIFGVGQHADQDAFHDKYIIGTQGQIYAYMPSDTILWGLHIYRHQNAGTILSRENFITLAVQGCGCNGTHSLAWFWSLEEMQTIPKMKVQIIIHANKIPQQWLPLLCYSAHAGGTTGITPPCPCHELVARLLVSYLEVAVYYDRLSLADSVLTLMTQRDSSEPLY